MEENNFYLINQEANEQGGLVFIFYCETGKSPDEKMFAELTIQPKVGIQLRVRTLCESGKEFIVPMMLQSVSFLLKT
jgi:hypothetical protein